MLFAGIGTCGKIGIGQLIEMENLVIRKLGLEVPGSDQLISKEVAVSYLMFLIKLDGWGSEFY